MTAGRFACRCRCRLWSVLIALVAVASLVSGCMWGFVTDSDTGAAVAGATVKVTDSDGVTHTTTTNANGLYAFDQAKGKYPAKGPVTVEVSASGYSSLTAPRLVEYDDNANASMADLSSFWEVQSFTLAPITTPSLNADLAVTDVYPDSQPNGTLWARITNNGPDTLTNADVWLTCQAERTDLTNCSKTTLGPVLVPLTISLNPGQTQNFDSAIGLDTAKYWYDALCVVQVSFTDPDSTNDVYPEVIPPPTGDLKLEDILLKTTNVVGFRLSASGSLPGTFWYSVGTRYPDGSQTTYGTSAPVPVGSQAFWTADTIIGTSTVEVWIDSGNCISETNETNNKMTKTCSASSHTCWSSGGGSILGAGTP
jgi:hypothetical protein